MTMVEGARGRSQVHDPVATWHEVDSGFWVGSADGEFLGSIERFARGRYLARDALHRTVGEYAGLGFARKAIVGRAERD